MKTKKIILGSDHAGYELKQFVKSYLGRNSIPYEEEGSANPEMPDDYPDTAKKLARKILKKKALGILICGSGIGMAMAANRIKGVRAAFCHDAYSAKMARHDNDANILTLRSRNFPKSKIPMIIKTFLDTEFSGLQRHKRRILKLDK